MSVSARMRFYSKLREQSFIVKHRGDFSCCAKKSLGREDEM